MATRPRLGVCSDGEEVLSLTCAWCCVAGVMLTVWRPGQDWESVREGGRYRIYSLTAAPARSAHSQDSSEIRCFCTGICTHTHTHTHANLHTHTQTLTHTHPLTYTHTQAHKPSHTHNLSFSLSSFTDQHHVCAPVPTRFCTFPLTLPSSHSPSEGPPSIKT